MCAQERWRAELEIFCLPAPSHRNGLQCSAEKGPCRWAFRRWSWQRCPQVTSLPAASAQRRDPVALSANGLRSEARSAFRYILKSLSSDTMLDQHDKMMQKSPHSTWMRRASLTAKTSSRTSCLSPGQCDEVGAARFPFGRRFLLKYFNYWFDISFNSSSKIIFLYN